MIILFFYTHSDILLYICQCHLCKLIFHCLLNL